MATRREIPLNLFRHWWPSIAFVFVVLFLFKTLWWNGKVLGFRDSLHFYYPLWFYVDALPMAERLLPKWNPLDAFGSSIVGEPTSMVFYPFRFLLHAPIGNLEQRIGWFMVLHFLIAYTTWILAGIRFRFELWDVQVSGIGYALSGPIFFQIYNPPFLVGAAWLPAAMAGVLGIAIQSTVKSNQTPSNSTRLGWAWGSFRNILSRDVAILSLSLTMMILGGDAQTVLHVALVGFLIVAGLALRDLFTHNTQLNSIRDSLLRFAKFATALAFAAGISAVQIAPTLEWLQHSERFETESGLNARPSTLNFHNRYDFFQEPWHLVTLAAPNVFGSFTPTHTRWAQVIPGDGRVWTPSLHVGTLVGLMALFNWRYRWQSPFCKASLFVAVIAFLSSLGEGGVYDLWTTCLPGYSYFRYPAKWTTMFAWAICFAASATFAPKPEAIALDVGVRRQVSFFFVVGLAGLALVVLHLAMVLSPKVLEFTYAFLEKVPEDKWCGPLDAQQVVRNIGWTGALMSFVGLASSVSWLGFSKGTIRSSITHRNVLMVIVIFELSVTARSQTCFVRPTCLNRNVARLTELPVESVAVRREPPGVLRDIHIITGRLAPFRDLNLATLCFNREGSAFTTPEKLAKRQSEALLGKLHLLSNARSFDAQFTFRPHMISVARNRSKTAKWLPHVLSVSDFGILQNEERSIEKKIDFAHVLIEGSRIDFDYISDEPVTIEIPMLDDGGWQNRDPALSDPKPALSQLKIVRTDSELLTVQLPAGRHRLRLIYWPPGLSIGMLVSTISVGIFAILGVQNLKFLATREGVGQDFFVGVFEDATARDAAS